MYCFILQALSYSHDSPVLNLVHCDCCYSNYNNYIVGHKKRATLLLSISSPIIDRFSKLFHCHTLQTKCNNVIIVYPTTQ